MSGLQTVVALDGAPADTAIDSLFHLESMFENHGYEQGLKDGAAAGFAEGRELGLAQGLAVGEEIGFYLGVGELLLQDGPDEASSSYSPRAIKMIQGLIKLANEFPRENNKEVDMIAMLEKIRGKYRALCSVLNWPHTPFVPSTQQQQPVANAAAAGSSSSGASTVQRPALSF